MAAVTRSACSGRNVTVIEVLSIHDTAADSKLSQSARSAKAGDSLSVVVLPLKTIHNLINQYKSNKTMIIKT